MLAMFTESGVGRMKRVHAPGSRCQPFALAAAAPEPQCECAVGEVSYVNGGKDSSRCRGGAGGAGGVDPDAPSRVHRISSFRGGAGFVAFVLDLEGEGKSIGEEVVGEVSRVRFQPVLVLIVAVVLRLRGLLGLGESDCLRGSLSESESEPSEGVGGWKGHRRSVVKVKTDAVIAGALLVCSSLHRFAEYDGRLDGFRTPLSSVPCTDRTTAIVFPLHYTPAFLPSTSIHTTMGDSRSTSFIVRRASQFRRVKLVSVTVKQLTDVAPLEFFLDGTQTDAKPAFARANWFSMADQ
ncbi:hypothetical protein FB45DRAFT_876591 [Roridomyces roridus]|uniref:Uncharacterized protein n=1 Tax=Roridomyces roridus TaxID=1738132 RepID=A0AAD7B4H1_9AGAR|nr:hypothetical protein FB45DRAFT_876591 [Roridomyces roridus]